uniref:Uncharacterized protein n=1 Tax=Knipowitschia caucasica TaxID=637954 RepID=A0AAV2LIQ8_KNICA
MKTGVSLIPLSESYLDCVGFRLQLHVFKGPSVHAPHTHGSAHRTGWRGGGAWPGLSEDVEITMNLSSALHAVHLSTRDLDSRNGAELKL